MVPGWEACGKYQQVSYVSPFVERRSRGSRAPTGPVETPPVDQWSWANVHQQQFQIIQVP